MNRILIIYRVDKSNPENIGVVKKLIGQVAGLEYSNYKVDYIIHDARHIYFNNRKVYNILEANIGYNFKWNYFNYLMDLNLENYRVCIIRYGLSSLSFINFLKRFRKKNVNAKILIDMPTFPYRKEHVGVIGRVKLIIDQVLSNKLKFLVDYVLHSGEEASIFGISTIKSSNGINCEQLKLRTYGHRTDFRMIAVGKWRNWHGLDRMIKGLDVHKYDSDIVLDIVGDGPELKRLKLLVKEKHLEGRVIFHGVCVGEKLNELFDQADIGVGTLGLFRKGVKVDSSLKNREYVARGLPIILSGKDSDIKSDLNFVCKVPNDESYIDIRKIESFLNGLDIDETIKRARSFAENQLSWNTKMNTLVKELGI